MASNGCDFSSHCECGTESASERQFLSRLANCPEFHQCGTADKVHFTIELVEIFLTNALSRTQRQQEGVGSPDACLRSNLNNELDFFFRAFPNAMNVNTAISSRQAESLFTQFISICAVEECFESLCSQFTVSYQLCLSVFLEVMGSVAWQRLLGIVMNYSASFSMETPLIKLASDWLRSLDECSIRELLSNPQWNVLVPRVYEYLGDNPPRNDSFETVISRQRHINRIIQALQMATTLVIADESGPINPFVDFVVHGLVLSPSVQPLRRIPDRFPESFICQSCLPNAEVKVEVAENSKISVNVIALRDISPIEKVYVSFPDNEMCSCFRCLPPKLLRQAFQDLIEDRLTSEVVECLDGLFNLYCSHRSDRLVESKSLLQSGKRKVGDAPVPEWQEFLRRLANIFDSQVSNDVQVHFPLLTEWRSYADFLSSSSSQFDASNACRQLSCAVAIYAGLLLIPASVAHEEFIARFRSEVALSLATALLEILTTAAQHSSAKENTGLALRLSASLEELHLVKKVVQFGLQQNCPCSTSEALRSILLKQDAFLDLTSIAVPVDSFPHRIRFCEVDHDETIIVAETLSPIFSDDECALIIADAENFAKTIGSGWSTSRHYSVPTTDLPITSLSHTVRSMVLERFSNKLLPFMRTVFSGSKEHDQQFGGFVFDLFVVKYDGSQSAQRHDRQTFLPLHRDQSAHSAVVALNRCGCDFVGGGTYFPVLSKNGEDSVVCPSKARFLLIP